MSLHDIPSPQLPQFTSADIITIGFLTAFPEIVTFILDLAG